MIEWPRLFDVMAMTSAMSSGSPNSQRRDESAADQRNPPGAIRPGVHDLQGDHAAHRNAGQNEVRRPPGRDAPRHVRQGWASCNVSPTVQQRSPPRRQALLAGRIATTTRDRNEIFHIDTLDADSRTFKRVQAQPADRKICPMRRREPINDAFL
ncbi:hypothetical protein GC209_13680 [bacterium]|nr:hypothetical protein [bacterium]